MNKPKRKKGFTLIELLVVITIIGILAGIAFVGFGDVFSTAGRTTAQKNLKTVYEALAAKTRSFPTDVTTVEEFVVWWRNKTKDTRPELWFINEDEAVSELREDDSGPGIPSNIPADAGDFDGDQVSALGYCVAVPGEGAETRNYLTSLRSGAFPLIWSRGLDGSQTAWELDGAWGGEGGHVLFSDGTVKWYDDTEGPDNNGIFMKAVGKLEKDPTFDSVKTIQEALPGGWKVLKPQ